MLKPGRYYYGTEIRLTADFFDDDGAGVDPDTITIKTYSPTGTISSYVYLTDANVGKAGTGSYYADVTPDKSGRWWYRWETTGTSKATVREGSFIVQESPFFANSVSDAWRDC